MIRLLLIAVWLAETSGPCAAQFLPSLQAKTPEEFDDYLLVFGAAQPIDAVEAAARFARRWPSSELSVRVFELQLEAYRKLGDVKGAKAAGELGLAAAHDYLPLLVETASLLANDARNPAELGTALQRAERALQLLQTATAPRYLRPDEWESATARLASRAHAVLGLVAFKKNRTALAIREFQEAVKLHPSPPDPSQQYRLAMLYRMQGRNSEARILLEQVERSGEPALQKLAQEGLEEIKTR